MRTFVALLSRVALLLLPLMAGAQGGPPMMTDDPDTPGDGRWEINLAVAGTRERAASETEGPLVDLNYGLGSRIQLKWEFPWVTRSTQDAGRVSGFGRTLLGLKWRFRDMDDKGIAVSAYPQLSTDLDRNSTRRGLTERGTGLLLPLEMAMRFGEVGVVMETGRQFGNRALRGWTDGLLVSIPATEKLEYLAEIHGSKSGPDRDAVLNLGTRVEIDDGIRVQAEIGKSFAGSDFPSHRWHFYLGVQLQR